jgi:uncharacterized protein DUF998
VSSARRSAEASVGSVSALTGATLRVRGAIRLCALCGIAGQIVLTVGWVIGDILQPATYIASRQEISDLGALTAAHAWVWNAADSLSGALTAIFALGLFALLRGDRAGRLGAALVGVSGLGDLLDGFVREDCPLSTSRACKALRKGPGLSWHHQIHDLESVIAGFAAILAPFLLAHAFARLPPWRSLFAYTLGTGIAGLVTVVGYLALYGKDGAGILQRAGTTILAAWLAALAVRSLSLTNPRRRASHG